MVCREKDRADWQIKREMLSASYTTVIRWEDIPVSRRR
ncbi:DUF4113 domain-containing protein [Pantoea sp. A4]